MDTVLGYGWFRAIRHLLAQEELERRPRMHPVARQRLPRMIRKVAGRLADYVRPGFHPDQHDNRGLARTYLASINRLAG